jgi:hypothetical protein
MPRMASQVITAVDDPGNWMIWLYGPWGCGKTVLAAGFPDTLMIDTEKSRRSLLNHPELYDIPILVAEEFDPFRRIVDEIILGHDDLYKRAKIIQIDTFSTLQQKELNHQMKKLPAGRNKDLPSEAEFNINNTRLRKALFDLYDNTDKNIIVVSHIKEEKDDEGNTVLIRPGNSPSISQSVANMASGIFYLQSKTDSKGVTTRTLKCMPGPRLWAKNRFASTLEREIPEPTSKDLVAAIERQQEIAKQAKTQTKENTDAHS